MAGQSCESCKSWVEGIYWSHFQFFHFAQVLHNGYEQQLALPKTFSDNLKKKLPETVGLRGPCGIVWNIGLTARDDTLYFTDGWQQFLKDHSLKENDFLVFRYNCGESLFDVLIFDGGSLCEKADSYFIRKCGHIELGGGCSSKGKYTDNSVGEEGNNTPTNAGVEGAAPERSVHNNSVRVPTAVPFESPSERTFNAGVESATPVQFMRTNGDMVPPAATPVQFMRTNGDMVPPTATPVQFMSTNGDMVPPSAPLQTAGKRIRKLVSAVQRVQTKRRGRPPKLSSADQGVVNWVTDSEHASAGQSGGYIELYTSNRRPVSDPEIAKTLRLAQAACTDHSLLIVMRPTHIYKRFYLSIPNKWIVDHLSPRSQDLVLRMGKDEWHVKYSFHRARFTGGLTGGWRNFALDNNLEEFDVCVFEPTGKVNDKMIMDVRIFRVVEDIVPLSKVNAPGKRRGRKRSMVSV